MSSWEDQKNGGYGTVYDIDYTPVTVCGDWILTFGAYIDEDDFWFDEDIEYGVGHTNIGAVAYLTNNDTGAEIRMPFGVDYNIFGVKNKPDEFYLYEPDRGLDHETGIGYDIDRTKGITEEEAETFIDDNLQEIFDAIIDVVNQNLYKFGYEL